MQRHPHDGMPSWAYHAECRRRAARVEQMFAHKRLHRNDPTKPWNGKRN